MQYKSLKIAVSAIATCLCFTACDDSTSKSSEKIETYSSVDKLPDCKSSNEGETVRVEKDSTVRVCANGSWYAVSENEDGSFDYSCETKALKDSSGVKIICGGDSVGVVKNTDSKSGKNGTDGKNGVDGKNGTDGHDGKDGSDGSDGKDGKDGADGHDGKDGTNGNDGKDGADGKDGTNGKDGADGKDGASCSAEVLKDLSGMKVVCGKDSVGVIRNGSNGAGCSLKQVGETLLQIKCGNDSTTFYVHGFYDPNSSSSVASSSSMGVTVKSRFDLPKCMAKADSGRIYVRDEELYYNCDSTAKYAAWKPDSARGYLVQSASILGTAIKGPFKFNSPLTLKEMRVQGDSLAYTSIVYNDEISSDKGNYVIPKVNLVFPYAEVAVKGLWRNEVSGDWSTDSLTLYALTDLSTDTVANVNILTHLEYARAKALVKKGYSVYAAKRQADLEILRAFGFATEVEYSERIKTFVKEESDYDNTNATLLAMSLLVMRGLNDKDIAALIETIRADIAADGVWDDKDGNKLKMADWAADFDSDKVRKNLKQWNVLDVPSFEKYLNDFWNNVYALGGCNEDSKGVVKKYENEMSKNNGFYYICKNNSWQEANDIEKDTYGWGEPEKGKENEAKAGDVNEDKYYFYEDGKWREATDEEVDVMGWTTNADVGEVREAARPGYYYILKSDKKWHKATTLEYDTYGIDVFDYEAGKVVAGRVHPTNFYVYLKKDKKFREAEQREVYVKRGCYSETQDTVIRVNFVAEYPVQDSGFACMQTTDSDGSTAYHWRNTFVTSQIKYSNVTYNTVKIGEQTWMAENLRYVYSDTRAGGLLSTAYAPKGDITLVSSYGYLYAWSAAMDSLGKVVSTNKNYACGYYYNKESCSIEENDRYRGICPSGWHLPSKKEFEALVAYVNGEGSYKSDNMAGKSLKKYGGLNLYGFNGMLAGLKSNATSNSYTGYSNVGVFWTKDSYSSTSPYVLALGYYNDNALVTYSSANLKNSSTSQTYNFTSSSYASVRCIKDE